MDLSIKIGIPEKGKFLISEPFLLDPSFKRTVVLLTEHDEEGSVGFVLNRPLDANINDALVDFPDFEAPLYMGGPVQPDTLHYIHRLGDELDNSQEIFEGLYWGGDFEKLKLLIETRHISKNDIRFFIGYSGWDTGQLEDELKWKSWIVAKATMENVFHTNTNQLWKKVLKEMGRNYEVLSNYPEDPRLN